MKSNNLLKRRINLVPTLVVALLLISGFGFMRAQCNASFIFSYGANGLVTFSSTSTGAASGTTYNWTFYGPNGSSTANGNTVNHTYSGNGQFVVSLNITDTSSNCNSTAYDTVNVVNVNPPCTASVSYSLVKDTSLTLTWNAFPNYPSNITNATWTWGDGTSSTGLYPSHTYSSAGTYSTCVTVSVSCGTVTATYCYVASIFRSTQSNESNAMIQLNVKQTIPTGIAAKTKADARLTVYPNPGKGEFFVDFNENTNTVKEATLMIYNMLGQMVFEKNVSATGKQIIDASSFGNGSYLLVVKSDTGYQHQRIIIQK